jgi:DegV family protein with EDD domain
MAVRIFVDSSSDITPELAAELNIHVVPLTIHFGDMVYKDRIDITPALFYEQIRKSKTPPNTSQPSPGEFLKIYEEHSSPGDTILSFHISSKLSGTYQSAVLASKQITDRTVHVIDTFSVSMGVAIPAVYAARWAATGVAVTEILSRCAKMIASTRIYFLVDTLEYLQRNGRIGKAQAVVGSLLNIKPVLCMDDGEVAAADRVRGKVQAKARLVDLAFSDVKQARKYACAVMDAVNPQERDALASITKERLPEVDLYQAPLGPVVGTHAGPGTVGIIITEME